MQNHKNTAKSNAEIDLPTEPATPHRKPWHAEVSALLTRAAALCVEHGVELDSFMTGAYSAYVEARPGMRDLLEEMKLLEQIEEVRRTGRMAKA